MPYSLYLMWARPNGAYYKEFEVKSLAGAADIVQCLATNLRTPPTEATFDDGKRSVFLMLAGEVL